ncbi:MAG: insulinase family protein [Luminiphilus sp.]|nr:insulinase family protein [Luminiphilus sp.]MDG1461723.1 insulinase family protein [Luminiphilus sp.]
MESLAQDPVTVTFQKQRSATITALNVTVEEYVHPSTGAQHLHLQCDNPENVFMVALRTVPEDSTGVAHILEHTVLCGSENYPVRDPFFMMLRRSLNTFMNAFTSSDWTAYPFATQNRKDFSNLLSVYLDAVFFSRLDPLDFAQEGHRVEFENPEDAKGNLVFKGVVFNEMKGAMSSVSAVLWDRLCFELFPSNTYHHNSGGDPENIPDLSYQELRDFYTRHYHPSNAVFLTFGDIPAQDHQAVFETAVLNRFEASETKISVDLEHAFSAPTRATHPYAVEDDGELGRKTHHVIGWKLGESSDLLAMLEAQVLAAVLMENSASPLMHFLETTPLGTAPSPLCGVEESMREMVFCCGIEGSDSNQVEEFENAVIEVIKTISETGIPAERLEAILHQIELSQRELTGDGMPYGLNLMLRALGAAVHGGDSLAALNLDPILETIRERSLSNDYVPGLIRRLLLDNPHRVTLTLAPDSNLTTGRENAERGRLNSMAASLDDAGRSKILDLAEKLKARQAIEDDPDILPKVTLSDIPDDVSEPKSSVAHKKGIDVWNYTTGTNGLVYQQWVKPLPALSEQEMANLPLVTGLIGELGAGPADYLAIQERQSATVGALSVATMTRSSRADVQDCSGWLLISSKALANRSQQQAALMQDTFSNTRFDEGPRIRELINQIRARRDQSITGSGHSLAMTAATAGMSPLALRAHEQGGLEGIRGLRKLDDRLANDSELQGFMAQLSEVHGGIVEAQGLQIAVIADSQNIKAAENHALEALESGSQGAAGQLWQPEAIREHRHEAWITNTQVNFCAKAYQTVPSSHADAPALTVLSAVLRNGFLHRAIREQGGAYGGGASHDGNVGAFRFFSYRDPRLGETLADFDGAIDWFMAKNHEAETLEEAILGIIGSLDKPGSPAGEARKHFHESLFARTADHRAAFRRGVISTTLDDLRRVAETYLLNAESSTAIITNTQIATREAALIAELGLKQRDLS